MNYSKLGLDDFQFLRAFRARFSTTTLRRAVRATARRTIRARLLPDWLVLSFCIVWFFKPKERFPAIARWFQTSRRAQPSSPAFYQARQRLGYAPTYWLRRHVVECLAHPDKDAGAFYDGRRLLALDGTTFTVADTPANERTFGRSKNQHRTSGYPMLRVGALCEVGTHALVAWKARRVRCSELALARRLWRHIPAGSLLLADRYFHCYELWQHAKGKFALLIRVQSGPKFPIYKQLADGSYLSRVLPRRGKKRAARAIELRVIPFTWTDSTGKVQQGRLLTSLLDPVRHPAQTLLELYHQRWEEEGVIKEVKEQLEGRDMHLRAHTPLGVLQELDGLLMGHYVVRWAMLQAARKAGIAPVTVSFQGAVQVLQKRLVEKPCGRKAVEKWWQQVLTEMGRERVQKRRARSCPRAKKAPRCKWRAKKKEDVEQRLPTLHVQPVPEAVSLALADPPQQPKGEG